MGGRLRLICQDIHCVKPILPMPNLPVARVMWRGSSMATALIRVEPNSMPKITLLPFIVQTSF